MSSWEFGSVLEFQSTHLREVRRFNKGYIGIVSYYFNPRTYVRCDLAVKLQACISLISIHAPT